ncbi:unnamed protein product [Oncorhynchus mykiss]|uniref:Ig-like domain-containing protein n=1 Tax=Oncorhynchus mykiss TaxID=8022 RepID=A0A060XA56_ONCMY|nr:unnamed protein product [Oncorhynchus mykiss]
MACTLPLAFLVLHGFISLSAEDSCDNYFQPGDNFSIPLKYTDLRSKEITWKHNGNVIFKRKNGKFKPGKTEDILEDGSLQLKGLVSANEGTYKAEVFNIDGKSIKDQSFSLCMKGKSPSLFLSKHTSTVSSPLETLTFCFPPEKPSVKFTCSDKDVTFTCILTNTEGVTFEWSKNRQPLNGGKKKTLIIGLKQLKELDTFTCSAVNEVSTETSDIIKPTCKGTVCFEGLNCNSLCVSLCLFLSGFFSLSVFLLLFSGKESDRYLRLVEHHIKKTKTVKHLICLSFCSTPHPTPSSQLSQNRLIGVYCLVLIS